MLSRLGLLMMATVSRRTAGAVAAADSVSGNLDKAVKKKAQVPKRGVSTRSQTSHANQAPVKPKTKQYRKVVFSNSASSVNPKRNILQRGGAKGSSIAGLNKALNNLSLKSERTFSSSSKKTSAATSSRISSLEDIARLILNGKSKKIVVMAGAGISTPSGIPDFRTPGSGLYDNLQQYKIPYPEAIFDIMYFHSNQKPFFALARELYPGNYRPNYVHYFIKMLEKKGLLLRMYTQNIDGLERLAGLPAEKLVEAHGTFSKASCIRCQQSHEGDEIKNIILAGNIPKCKRQSCTGVVKPDIVFFGEDLPKRFFYYLKDMPQADLLIIMGTSLEVYPFAGIVDSTRANTPRLLINREAVGPFEKPKTSRPKDLAVTGDLVENVQKLAKVLGWKKAIEDLIKENESLLDATIGSSRNDNNSSSQEKNSQTEVKVPNSNKSNNTIENNHKNLSGQTGINRAKSEPPGSRSFHTHTNKKVETQKPLFEKVVPLGLPTRSKSLQSVVKNTKPTLPRVGHVRHAAGQWEHRSRQIAPSSSSSDDSSSGSSDDDSSDS